MGGDKIRVMIVDDSTFVRRALIRVLRNEPDIEIVGEARDGLSAVQIARELRPDVMTLDLQMPQLTGLDVLRVLHAELPTRMIMVSSFTQEGAEETFRALEEGAFDFVDKTEVRNRMDFARLGQSLVEKIRLAAGVEPPETGRPPAAVKTPVEPPAAGAGDPVESGAVAPAPAGGVPSGLLVVGASTGGPPAVRRFLAQLGPSLRCAVILIQHMPPGFTSGFARRLNQTSPLLVSEAGERERLLAGHVYVIPSGMEIDLEASEGGLWLSLHGSDDRHRHRPSLDRTLEVVSGVEVDEYVAVVLTGMGSDGAVGAPVFHKRGGRIFVQNEETCVIYGMPKAVGAAVSIDGEGAPEDLGRRVMELYG